MTPSMQDWPHFLAALMLVMTRFSGLMVFAPVFSSSAIPGRVKTAFVLAVSILVAPVIAGLPLSHTEIGIVPVLGELAVGAVLGLALSLLNEMLLFTGQVLGLQFSFSLVNLLDPNAPVETPLLGQMFSLIGILTILAAGLHRTLLAALLRSFAAAPLGGVMLDAKTGLGMVSMASGLFASAMELAAPVLAATLLFEMAVVLVSKLAPQLSVLAISIPAKTLIGYMVLLGALTLWSRFIEARFDMLLNAACGLLSHGLMRGTT